MNRLNGFLELAERGYPMVPVIIKRDPKGVKRPDFFAGWLWGGTTDVERIRDWYVQDPERMSFAICCGPAGVDVIDLDPKDHGPENWSATGLPSDGVQVLTPSGGVHLYWRAGQERLGTNGGKLAAGVDVRSSGGVTFAPGSVIVGTDEEIESAGYTGELPKVADLDPLPEAITRAYAAYRKPERAEDGQTVVKDRAWVIEAFRNQLAIVRAHDPATETGFSAKLMGAAMMLGRGVGVWPEELIVSRLEDACAAVWGKADDDDREKIHRAMRDGRAKEVWEIVGDGEITPAPPTGEEPRETPEDAHARRVQDRLAALRADHEARRLHARELRAHRPAIAAGILDDLDAIEPPAMLMGQLIPDRAIGFIAGRSGAYKSFLAVAWACCIATGRPWLGQAEFGVSEPRRTLYIAAEGASGAAARIKAWESYTGVSRAGKLHLYPRPVHLNDEGAAEELAEVVQQGGYQFLVVDTYHRSAPGAEENSSTDFGVIFEAVARLRDDFGCGVLFVDHTGHAGERLRGTSAKGDDADYVLTSSYEGLSRGADVQRTLTVAKLKDEESGRSWPVRLELATGADMPVVVIGTAGQTEGLSSLDTGSVWAKVWDAPEELGMLAVKDRLGSAEGAQCARDMLRVLDYLGDGVPVTDAEFTTAFAKRDDGGERWAKTSVKRGRKVLLELDLAHPASKGGGIERGPEPDDPFSVGD